MWNSISHGTFSFLFMGFGLLSVSVLTRNANAGLWIFSQSKPGTWLWCVLVWVNRHFTVEKQPSHRNPWLALHPFYWYNWAADILSSDIFLICVVCFLIPVCGCDLAQGGFFIKNGEYLCTLDYQRMYGTRCNGCGEFVEGEVVTALGKTYHPSCFACTVCK